MSRHRWRRLEGIDGYVDTVRSSGSVVVEAEAVIVTIVAYKRPELLKQCLDSVVAADLYQVTDIWVSCDWHSKEMRQRMYDVDTYSTDLPINFTFQTQRFGIHNHQRLLYTDAAGESNEICALEEDCVVSPDTFNMAHWALQQPGYKFVNLGHDNKLNLRTQPAPGLPTVDSFIWEDNQFRSSYAWAFTKDFWRELEPQWNGKIRAPYGWDWQVNYLCYREKWKCLTPEVPRAMNTGREGGTYETPDTYDRDRTGVVICQASPYMYSLVRGNWSTEQVTSDRELPEWVKEEMRP